MTARSERTRSLIVVTLLKAGRELRWSELLELTKLSPRTLSLRLDDLQRDAMVTRRVSAGSGEYPPPVSYELSQLAVDRLAEFSDAADRARSLFEDSLRRRSYLRRRTAQQALLAYRKMPPSFNEQEAFDKLINAVYEDILDDFSMFLVPVFDPSRIFNEIRSTVLEMKNSGQITLTRTFSLALSQQWKKDENDLVVGWLADEIPDHYKILAETDDVSREFESCLQGRRPLLGAEFGFPGIQAVIDQIKMFVTVAPSYTSEKMLARFQDMLRAHPYIEGRPSDQTVLAAWGRLRSLYQRNIADRSEFIKIYKQNQCRSPSPQEMAAWHVLLGTVDEIYEKLKEDLIPGRFTHTFNMCETFREIREELFRSPGYLNALTGQRITLLLKRWRERVLVKFET